MIGQYVTDTVKRYANEMLTYFEREHPGQAISYAKEGKDIVPEIVQNYFPGMNQISPPLLGMIRYFVQSYNIRELSMPIIRDVIEDFKNRPDEIGSIAREYPDWMEDQLRRLLNLAILYLRGNADVGKGADSIRDDK